MAISALSEKGASGAESPHEDAEDGSGGGSRSAEHETKLAHPYRLVNEGAKTGTEKKQGNPHRCAPLYEDTQRRLVVRSLSESAACETCRQPLQPDVLRPARERCSGHA